MSPGVVEELPGLYEWKIKGSGSYIGKYTSIRRPTWEYPNNVRRHLDGIPHRNDKYRRIHCELARACREELKITLKILMNAQGQEGNKLEALLIAKRGALNDPPFGRRVPNDSILSFGASQCRGHSLMPIRPSRAASS